MSDIKRRKVPRDENSEVRRKTKTQSYSLKTNRFRFYFLTALLFITFSLVVYFHLFQWSSSNKHGAGLLDSLSLTLGLQNYIYSIVIDAGSTGSRILLYGFFISRGKNSLKLDTEFFKEVKPGISAYANNPAESLKGLSSLLNEAKIRIPKEEWSKTTVVVKATAGLRLLPDRKADTLLAEAKKFFKHSGFKVNEDSISIIDEKEEGLFAWFTINFLLDRLGGEALNTAVALDLGGGSTQISFVPLHNDTLSASQSQHLTKIEAFHKDLQVYSRSYLGLGLNEARKQILQHNSNHSSILKSECINPLVKTKWEYGGVTYTIQGPEKPHYARSEEKGDVFVTPIVEYKECEEIVKSVVSKFEKTPTLKGKEIYAFSYYYQRAADSGLIDFKKGGKVTLHEFIATAKAKCHEANVDQPFMCLDLVFIIVLLRDLYNIPETLEINLVKHIDNHEISWALGAAFYTLTNQLG